MKRKIHPLLNISHCIHCIKHMRNQYHNDKKNKTAVCTHRWMNAKQANRSCDLSIRQDYMHLTIDNQQFRHSIWKRSQSVWLGFITLMPTWASVNLFHRPVGGVAKSYRCIQYHSSNIKVRKSLLREKSRGNPQFNFFFKY